jgi:hypothetical protein
MPVDAVWHAAPSTPMPLSHRRDYIGVTSKPIPHFKEATTILDKLKHRENKIDRAHRTI